MNYIISNSNNNYKKIDWDNINLKKINYKRSIIYKKFQEDISSSKSIIDTLENNSDWDKMKKIGNPYELIYTTYNKKKRKDSISDYQPISRSFFKLWEIDKTFNIIDNNCKKEIYVANLAEGPGGFMEEILKNYTGNKIKMYGITLPPTNKYVPDWKKFLNYHDTKNIHVVYGNLYKTYDIEKYVKLFEKDKVSLVTADGGFDYSSDFNKQEINSHKIIFSEIAISLLILKKGGNFVCKIFDMFTLFTVKIVYLLTFFFKEVNIYKPFTSRPANSEKYLVCKNFIKRNEKVNFHIWKLLKQLEKIVLDKDESFDIVNFNLNNQIYRKIHKYNKEYIKNQMYYINHTMFLVKNRPDKMEYNTIINNQVKNAIIWCNKFKMDINKNSSYYKKYILYKENLNKPLDEIYSDNKKKKYNICLNLNKNKIKTI